MKLTPPQNSDGAPRQPSKVELLRRIEKLKGQQDLLIGEIEHLLARVAVYRGLAQSALTRQGTLRKRVKRNGA